MDTRVGGADGASQVDIRGGPTGRQFLERHVEGGFLAVHRQGQRLDGLQRRPGARVSVRSTQHGGADYWGRHRLGDNLFAEMLLCSDIKTAGRVWHYEFVDHGLWDYDLPAAAGSACHHGRRTTEQSGCADHTTGVRVHV